MLDLDRSLTRPGILYNSALSSSVVAPPTFLDSGSSASPTNCDSISSVLLAVPIPSSDVHVIVAPSSEIVVDNPISELLFVLDLHRHNAPLNGIPAISGETPLSPFLASASS